MTDGKHETTGRKSFSDLAILDAYDRMREIIRLYVDPLQVRQCDAEDVEEILRDD